MTQNITQLRASIEDELANNESKIDRYDAEMRAILDAAERQGLTYLSRNNEARMEALYADIRKAQAANGRIRSRLANARAVEAEESESDRRLEVRHNLDGTETHSNVSYDQTVRIGNEPSVYRENPRLNYDGTPAEPTYLQDLYRCQVLKDPGASERIARHGRQIEIERPGVMTRAMGTGAVSGFVPPQYLSNLFAEYARAGRPVANLCSQLPLPAVGMKLEIPRVTTPTAVAVQQTEGGAIGNQDLDDTLEEVDVVTVAGYVDLSRQALERGVMVETLVFGDLAAAYNNMLDAQVINGSGSNGQHLGILNVSSINAVTYTDASPSVGAVWPKLASAVGQVVSGRYSGPNAIVVHPDFWAWLLAEVNTTDGRPMLEPGSVALNPLGTVNSPGYEGVVGSLFSTPVRLDGNIPANLGTGTDETRVIAADFRDLILFEETNKAPAQLRFEDVLSSTLQVRLVAYGYSAFSGGRYPKAISVISGTGLIVPSL